MAHRVRLRHAFFFGLVLAVAALVGAASVTERLRTRERRVPLASADRFLAAQRRSGLGGHEDTQSRAHDALFKNPLEMGVFKDFKGKVEKTAKDFVEDKLLPKVDAVKKDLLQTKANLEQELERCKNGVKGHAKQAVTNLLKGDLGAIQGGINNVKGEVQQCVDNTKNELQTVAKKLKNHVDSSVATMMKLADQMAQHSRKLFPELANAAGKHIGEVLGGFHNLIAPLTNVHSMPNVVPPDTEKITPQERTGPRGSYGSQTDLLWNAGGGG